MVQHEDTWSFEHSVDCGASVPFAWAFWTNVGNWALDADLESVEIDGPFAAGAQGVTTSRSSGRIAWRIVEARAGKAVIETPLSGAVSQFIWTFEEAAGGCRITQRWTLRGDRAAVYASDFGPMMEAGIPMGMAKLCATIESAARAS
jgi:hypothetical protein